MKDDFLSREWAENHHTFTNGLSAFIDAVLRGLFGWRHHRPKTNGCKSTSD